VFYSIYYVEESQDKWDYFNTNLSNLIISVRVKNNITNVKNVLTQIIIAVLLQYKYLSKCDTILCICVFNATGLRAANKLYLYNV